MLIILNSSSNSIFLQQYQFDSLKSICEESLSQGLTIDSALKLLVLSDMHNADKLKSSCLEFISEHPNEVSLEDWRSIISVRPDLSFYLYQSLFQKHFNDKK